MSTTGTTNNSLASILRVDAQVRGQVNALRSTVTPYRKATRTRASSVIVRQTMPWSKNTTGCELKTPKTQAQMLGDTGERWVLSCEDDTWLTTTGKATKPTVVRPGGRTTLDDYRR